MILVTLGTQKEQFKRLLGYIEKSNIKEKIIVQAGYTEFESKKMEIFDFVDYEKMEKYVDKADLIITHGGTGSIIEPLKKDKKVIACSRLSKYNEHVDDHQQEIVNVFSDEGYILKLDENSNIDELYNEIKRFKPKKFKSNTQNFIKKLEYEISNKTTKNFSNLIFLFLFFSILSLGCLTLLKNHRLISETENRSLSNFSIFEISSFLNKTFQDNMEKALSDQFIGSETIKKTIKKISNFYKVDNLPKFLCSDSYLLVGEKTYVFDCNSSMTSHPNSMTEETFVTINSKMQLYNKMNEYTDMYYYVINRPSNFDFFTNKYSIDIKKIMIEKMKGNYKISSLEFHNYSEYINYYYKNDHHWNYKGSYQGYKDIISMMIPSDKLLTPLDTVNFDFSFYGSYSRTTNIYDFEDPFIVYKFDIKDHTVYINGKLGNYGRSSEYFKGNYDTNILTNHYGKFYGSDEAEVIFDFNDDSKPNTLIIGTSFNDSIKLLIASHFNKTYALDLRYYKSTFNKKFNFKDYIEKNDIDKVLIVTNYNSLRDDNYVIDME